MNAAKLRGVIAERGKTQNDVAIAIGITPRTFYAKMKSGHFGVDEAEKMVKYLDIQNPADIFLTSP